MHASMPSAKYLLYVSTATHQHCACVKLAGNLKDASTMSKEQGGTVDLSKHVYVTINVYIMDTQLHHTLIVQRQELTADCPLTRTVSSLNGHLTHGNSPHHKQWTLLAGKHSRRLSPRDVAKGRLMRPILPHPPPHSNAKSRIEPLPQRITTGPLQALKSRWASQVFRLLWRRLWRPVALLGGRLRRPVALLGGCPLQWAEQRRPFWLARLPAAGTSRKRRRAHQGRLL